MKNGVINSILNGEYKMKIDNEHELTQESKKLLDSFYELIRSLWTNKKNQFNRVLPLGEYFVERHEKSAFLGFGKGTTIYDSAVVIGNVKVGNDTWIGPFVVLDGSGNLSIGSNCSISAGVQIYTHDSVDWAISGGELPYQYAETVIEDNCYIGPNTIIQKGVRIGTGSIIGANSFVNKDVPSKSKAYGSPIKISNQSEVCT